MEDEVRRQNASAMSRTALVVRDIIARLLDTEAGTITAESDFFLLGGNSLLLGRLVHLIRKETGVSLEVSTLFNNSTVAGIASVIEDEQGGDDDDDDDMMDGLEEGHAKLFRWSSSLRRGRCGSSLRFSRISTS